MGRVRGQCPQDKPRQVKAVPQCIGGSVQSCGLKCSPGQCGHGARCRQAEGICTYDHNGTASEDELPSDTPDNVAMPSEFSGRKKGSHYGNPKNGCLADEHVFMASYGWVCAPACVRGQCPQDKPRQVKAVPQCIGGSVQSCGLKCSPGQCGH